MNNEKIKKAKEKVLHLAELWFLSTRVTDQPTPATYERIDEAENKLHDAIYKLRRLKGEL